MLRAANVQLNEHAETLIELPIFESPVRQTKAFVARSVEQLKLPNGGTLSQIYAAAFDCGLELVPLEAAPFLRLSTTGQRNASDSELSAGRPPTGAIHIASEPVNEGADFSNGFYLRVVDQQLWLRGFRCDEAFVFGPEHWFYFALPTEVCAMA